MIPRFLMVAPRIVCAWCGVTMKEGGEPISHSICPKCVTRMEAEGFDFSHDNKGV